jgi:DNA-binding NarL/FixJ family response regulator
MGDGALTEQGREDLSPERAAAAAASGAVTDPTPRSSPIRVVIVDDHALVREGTAQLLEAEADLEVVGQAGTAEQGLHQLERLRPDVALVDVNLPGISGLELARRAAASYPTVRILIVSAYDDYAYVTEALEIGVGGYLLKTASGKEVVNAVRAVADGTFVIDRALSGRLRRRSPSGPTKSIALTERQIEILALLARAMSNKRIANELGLGLRTVESHVSMILAKLGVESRSEAMLYALSHHPAATTEHGEPNSPP